MRQQIRPFYNENELNKVYIDRGAYNAGGDIHTKRILFTKNLLSIAGIQEPIQSIADLSCGDGTLIHCLCKHYNANEAYIGDYNKENIDRTKEKLKNRDVKTLQGTIEKTIWEIPKKVDVLLMTEILEHLEDPDSIMKIAFYRAKSVIISTPLDEVGNGNPGHYWSWGKQDIYDMLYEIGWEPLIYSELTLLKPRSDLKFQFWVATSNG